MERTKGIVIHGSGGGRLIGYPTAKVQIKRIEPPIFGIFAVRIRCEDAKWHKGFANFGNSVLGAIRTKMVEVHILDFDKDIYGKEVEIDYIQRLADGVKRCKDSEEFKGEFCKFAEQIRTLDYA